MSPVAAIISLARHRPVIATGCWALLAAAVGALSAWGTSGATSHLSEVVVWAVVASVVTTPVMALRFFRDRV